MLPKTVPIMSAGSLIVRAFQKISQGDAKLRNANFGFSSNEVLHNIFKVARVVLYIWLCSVYHIGILLIHDL